jgi:heme/copper-type cytochrome/quinol oxidase subunit 2
MYKIFMIVGLAVVVVGWAIYFVWDHKMRQQEKNQPKPRSERLQKTQSEISDWAKQMAAFKKPVYKKPDDESTPQQPKS